MAGEIELTAEQITQWEKGYQRFEKVRKMTTREFHDLQLRHLSGEACFDELIDSFEVLT